MIVKRVRGARSWVGRYGNKCMPSSIDLNGRNIDDPYNNRKESGLRAGWLYICLPQTGSWRGTEV